MSYWDTSALAKLYVPEPDSALFHQHAASMTGELVVSRLAIWEMRRVALRKEADGAIQQNGAELVWRKIEEDAVSGRLRVLEPDRRVASAFERIMTQCYRRSPVIAVRTFDAMHLATALAAGETEIVATDKKLREASSALGFSIFPV